MKVVLLRVGIDTGSGGIHGPLFRDGSFEYVPIPDCTDGRGIDDRTYGNTPGRFGRSLVEYFPENRRTRTQHQAMHVDPEFETFTYGDPTSPKAGLRRLTRGDLLVFYCGLTGWDCPSEPALYIMGYFEVEVAGFATEFSQREVGKQFGANFHVRHSTVYKRQKDCLVLVKGSSASRLLRKAVKISVSGRDRSGRRLKVLSPAMRKVLCDFGGHISIQRSPPRWVEESHVKGAAGFVRSLE